MPDPLSPLFAELYLQEGLDRSIDQAMVDLWMPFNVDNFIQRPLFSTVNGYAYMRADYHVTCGCVGSFRRFCIGMSPRFQDSCDVSCLTGATP